MQKASNNNIIFNDVVDEDGVLNRKTALAFILAE
jgi:hypothetical protein